MATYVRQQEITHRIGAHGRLQIRVTDADLQLRATDGDEVALRATFEIHAGSDEEADRLFDEARLEVVARDESLEVSERDYRKDLASTLRRLVSGRDGMQLSLAGTAPRGTTLRIDGVSGDLVIEGMRGEQRYSTVSGDLYATELGGSAQVTTVSGDATLRAVDRFALGAQAVSGDISAIAPVLASAKLSTVSGDIELEAQFDRRGDFRADSVSGEMVIGLVGSATIEVHGVSSDLRVEMDHRLEGRADRRRAVIGDGIPRIAFHSMSGDVLVRQPRRLEPAAATAGEPSVSGAGDVTSAPSDEETMALLRALERGEIDVDEAARRLGEGSSDA
jgi:Toastrack DUF4097